MMKLAQSKNKSFIFQEMIWSRLRKLILDNYFLDPKEFFKILLNEQLKKLVYREFETETMSAISYVKK